MSSCSVLSCLRHFPQCVSFTSASVIGFAACLIHVGEGRDTNAKSDKVNESNSESILSEKSETGIPWGVSGLYSFLKPL